MASETPNNVVNFGWNELTLNLVGGLFILEALHPQWRTLHRLHKSQTHEPYKLPIENQGVSTINSIIHMQGNLIRHVCVCVRVCMAPLWARPTPWIILAVGSNRKLSHLVLDYKSQRLSYQVPQKLEFKCKSYTKIDKGRHSFCTPLEFSHKDISNTISLKGFLQVYSYRGKALPGNKTTGVDKWHVRT